MSGPGRAVHARDSEERVRLVSAWPCIREGLMRMGRVGRSRSVATDVKRVFRPIAALPHAIFDDAPQGFHAVAPADLFSFFVGSTVVGDPDLEDLQTPMAQLRRDLRFEAEAVLFESDGLQHVAPDQLVARLHVREIQVREHVRERREQTVPDVVPEVEDTFVLRALET